MASSSPWDPGLASPVSSITRFIKGNRMTRFYALWVHHKGACWTIWLGCPKDKIVRLVRLFHSHHDGGLADAPWTALSSRCGPNPDARMSGADNSPEHHRFLYSPTLWWGCCFGRVRAGITGPCVIF
ncbi:hypothetical protein ACSZOD_18660 [Aeromonas hydrophila]